MHIASLSKIHLSHHMNQVGDKYIYHTPIHMHLLHHMNQVWDICIILLLNIHLSHHMDQVGDEYTCLPPLQYTPLSSHEICMHFIILSVIVTHWILDTVYYSINISLNPRHVEEKLLLMGINL